MAQYKKTLAQFEYRILQSLIKATHFRYINVQAFCEVRVMSQ